METYEGLLALGWKQDGKMFGKDNNLCLLIMGNNVGVYNFQFDYWEKVPIPMSCQLSFKENEKVDDSTKKFVKEMIKDQG